MGHYYHHPTFIGPCSCETDIVPLLLLLCLALPPTFALYLPLPCLWVLTPIHYLITLLWFPFAFAALCLVVSLVLLVWLLLVLCLPPHTGPLLLLCPQCCYPQFTCRDLERQCNPQPPSPCTLCVPCQRALPSCCCVCPLPYPTLACPTVLVPFRSPFFLVLCVPFPFPLYLPVAHYLWDTLGSPTLVAWLFTLPFGWFPIYCG